jgi:hypothetical protein
VSIRRFTVLALALGVGCVVPAHAAVKVKQPPPVCHLLVDPSGDSGPFANTAGSAAAPLQDPSLDITGADVASDGVTVTGVIRVAKLTATSDQSKFGRQWEINFLVAGKSAGLVATNSPIDGTSYGTAKGVFDTARNEIRMSITWAELTAGTKVPKGTKISSLSVNANAVVARPAATGGNVVSLLYGNYDDAISTSTYTVGALSCVKVGG